MSYTRWLVIAAAGFAVAGCAAPGGSVSTRAVSADPQSTSMDTGLPLDRPGTRLTIRNPDASQWMPSNRQTNQQNRTTTTIWVCRPLACAGKSAAVAIQTSPSPTRSPNKAALERVAKLIPAQAKAQDIMMDAASDGDERLTPLASKVTQVRDYPAILTEMKRSSRGKVNYIYRGDLFIGLFVVRVIAVSSERPEAQKNFAAFVSAFDVIDQPPGPPAEPTPVALDSPPPPPAAPAPGEMISGY